MKKRGFLLVAVSLAFAVLVLVVSQVAGLQPPSAKPNWAFNGTVIEACTCEMFCPCYFGTKPEPAAPHDHGAGKHYCRFNMGYKVNQGSLGAVKLDGIKFWIAGDLGDDYGDGATDWAEVTFEPSVTKEQRDAVAVILGHVYPVKWGSFTIGKDASIEWKATGQRAEARLDGGKAAEVVLLHNPTAMSAEQSVVKNVRYFGAARNDGFVLMPNQVQAYKVGKNAFETRGTNGFMITLDMTSKDVK